MNKSIQTYFCKLSDWINPEDIFATLFAQESTSFWLDSSLTNNENRFSYMGASPKEIYSYVLKNMKITIQTKDKRIEKEQDIFTFLETKLAHMRLKNTRLPFPFVGGFVGYFGYELKALTGAKQSHHSSYPDSLWFCVDRFIAFDHQEKVVYLVSITTDKSDAELWFSKIKSQLTLRKKSFAKNQNINTPHFTFSRSRQQYLADIQRCKNYLAKGESYQICLTNTLTTQTNLDPFMLYQTLRKKNPAPYSAYIRYHDLAILCSSPEQFLAVDQQRSVQTKPIKGTVKRGVTKKEDRLLAKELTENKKEWSENAMIVDLLRNDLGKVCTFGSVHVEKKVALESYQTVHHLVSTITGKLRDKVSLIDVVTACFPGGSMTGTPKARTLEILDELEQKARGIYSGALGYFSCNQTMMLNIVIRTMIMQRRKLEIGAGGAILAESDSQKEYDEMLLKTKALVHSINSSYTTPMHNIYLALGSNVGDKENYINQAIERLAEEIQEITVGKLYETKPMYYEEQDVFVNTVLSGKTTLSPQELFTFIKRLEKEIGRKKRFRNGPREIDIDILFYDKFIYEDPDLQIPHPRIAERAFVLQPFSDIAPDFKHPLLQKTIQELYTDLLKKNNS